MSQLDVHKYQRLYIQPVPPSWGPALHELLSDIFHSLHFKDQEILARYRAYMAELGPPSSSDFLIPNITAGSYVAHPITATLLSLHNAQYNSAPLRLLSAILISATFDPANASGAGRKNLLKLAQIIRGEIKDRDSLLKVLCRNAGSISQLPRIMNSGLNHQNPNARNEFKRYCGRFWTTWLSDQIAHWIACDGQIPETPRIEYLVVKPITPNRDQDLSTYCA